MMSILRLFLFLFYYFSGLVDTGSDASVPHQNKGAYKLNLTPL